jgi:hypothetical protein
MFPEHGEMPPNLTIRCEARPGQFDLAAYVAEQQEAMKGGVTGFELVNEINNKKDFWTYVISIVEWGPRDSRIRQKQAYIYVPGASPRLFTMTGTDLSGNFVNSEPLFNEVIKSFAPNEIQLF